MTVPPQDLEHFESSRVRLGAIAYRLLGSAAEAEDAVQETYLRWAAADRDSIQSPPAWLTRVLTNLCLNQLSSARARREASVGPWLPEPLLEDDPLLGPAEAAEQRDGVSLGMLDLLETLPPLERAAFVLREAFTYPHAQIAEILGTTESGSQQALARARRRLGSGHRRRAVDAETSRAVVAAFLEAAAGGDLDRLIALLSDDVTSRADGGGAYPTARRPIQGARAVATYLRGVFRPTAQKTRLTGGPVDLHVTWANRAPALLAASGDRLLGIVTLELDGERIRDIRIQLAPGKLERAAAHWRRTAPRPPVARIW